DSSKKDIKCRKYRAVTHLLSERCSNRQTHVSYLQLVIITSVVVGFIGVISSSRSICSRYPAK
ncbi:MAG: hypothetical protein WBE34_17500, partial [Candidatus Nitrosopolaris sp.]